MEDIVDTEDLMERAREFQGQDIEELERPSRPTPDDQSPYQAWGRDPKSGEDVIVKENGESYTANSNKRVADKDVLPFD
ncbi:unnamed protein product, partial [Mesorhabditis belari]|uniref:Uncharacterized protein n=1 Tax=Mesorhabditis belari TaxID=2138241 RepID=A0AAF3FIC4_9BILA